MSFEFDKKEFLLSIGRTVLTSVIGGYVFLSLFLYVKQDEMIFLKPKISISEVAQINEFYKASTEEIVIKTPDGAILHGWLNKETTDKPTPLVIYFGGNGEELSTAIPDKKLYFGYSLAVINYRGYGISTGSPSEENLYEDSLLIYDTLTKRPDIDNTKVVIMGRSLGSAVATYLATQRNSIGVILVTPFDSALSVARELHPILPMKHILKYKFDSVSLAPELKVPLLLMASSNDKIIPIKHAKLLYDAWGSEIKKPKKEMLTFNGSGHNNIALSRDYWLEIGKFLKTLL